MGEECQDGLWKPSAQEYILGVQKDTNLGDVFPVPAVHLEVGILPLGECNPQWSCVVSLEERFVSWDSPYPEQEMTPWLGLELRSVQTIRK